MTWFNPFKMKSKKAIQPDIQPKEESKEVIQAIIIQNKIKDRIQEMRNANMYGVGLQSLERLHFGLSVKLGVAFR